MAMPKKFKSGIRVRLLATKILSGGPGQDPHWAITVNKSGFRRLIQFVAAGGTRNILDQHQKIKAGLDAGTARALARTVTAKQDYRRRKPVRWARKLVNASDWQDKTVRIAGWQPQENTSYNEFLKDTKAIAEWEQAGKEDEAKELKELKELFVQKANEVKQDLGYRQLRGSLQRLHILNEEDEDEGATPLALAKAQTDRFLAAVAGNDPQIWTNLLQSNVFDDASKPPLRKFRGNQRLLLGMILTGTLDQAGTIMDSYAPKNNPAYQK